MPRFAHLHALDGLRGVARPRGGAVPLCAERLAGRVPRRGPVLRAERLPHHQLARHRVGTAPAKSRCHRVLGSTRWPAPARAVPRAARGRHLRPRGHEPGRRPPVRRPTASRRCSTWRTGTSSRRASPTSSSSCTRRRARCATPGHWRSRSSSTWSGRWSSSGSQRSRAAGRAGSPATSPRVRRLLVLGACVVLGVASFLRHDHALRPRAATRRVSTRAPTPAAFVILIGAALGRAQRRPSRRSTRRPSRAH